MIAGTNVRRRRSGLGSHTAKPECSASLRHRDDRDRAPFHEWPMTAGATARTAGTTARRRRSGPGYYTAQLGCYTSKPDCSVPLRHRDDRVLAPFREWSMIAGTDLRRRRSGLGSHTDLPEYSAIERHRDDRDQAPFREWPMIAGATARRRRSGLARHTAK